MTSDLPDRLELLYEYVDNAMRRMLDEDPDDVASHYNPPQRNCGSWSAASTSGPPRRRG
jgi:hypothetical protein